MQTLNNMTQLASGYTSLKSILRVKKKEQLLNSLTRVFIKWNFNRRD